VTGAICGGGYPWKSEPEPERWCYGERKRRTGKHVLYGMWPDPNVLPTLEDGEIDPVVMWEPVWRYKCDGCGHDWRWMW